MTKKQADANTNAVSTLKTGLKAITSYFDLPGTGTAKSLMIQTYYNVEKRLSTLHRPTVNRKMSNRDGSFSFAEVINVESVSYNKDLLDKMLRKAEGGEIDIKACADQEAHIQTIESEIALLFEARSVMATFLDQEFAYTVKQWSHGEQNVDSQVAVDSTVATQIAEMRARMTA